MEPKDQSEFQKEYRGEKCTVRHCVGAIDSFNEVVSKSFPTKKAASMKRALIGLIKRLAAGHRMSKQDFPIEGSLPKRPGKKTGDFYAFKKIPVRAYVWKSDRLPSFYYISHYVYKDYEKLADADTNRVGENWTRIEENGNDY